MDMGTDFLACFGRSKGANDRYLRPVIPLRYAISMRYRRVKFGWSRLIVIDTIQTDTKDFHPATQEGENLNLIIIALEPSIKQINELFEISTEHYLSSCGHGMSRRVAYGFIVSVMINQ
jgi:hypothetical protein